MTNWRPLGSDIFLFLNRASTFAQINSHPINIQQHAYAPDAIKNYY